MNNYFQLVRLCENTYRAFLWSMKHALFELDINDISPIQALIILNLDKNEINIKDFIRRGYYGGSNVTYNLKSLIKNGYMLCRDNPQDLRVKKISLSKKGIDVLKKLTNTVDHYSESINVAGIDNKDIYLLNNNLKNIHKTVELSSISI